MLLSRYSRTDDRNYESISSSTSLISEKLGKQKQWCDCKSQLLYQCVNGRDGIDIDSKQWFVVVNPLHAGQVDLRVKHGVVWWRSVHGDRQTELSSEQPTITQQRQPRVTNDCLQLAPDLQLTLTAHVIEREQYVVRVCQPCRQQHLHLIIETWTSVVQHTLYMTHYQNTTMIRRKVRKQQT